MAIEGWMAEQRLLGQGVEDKVADMSKKEYQVVLVVFGISVIFWGFAIALGVARAAEVMLSNPEPGWWRSRGMK